MANIKARKVHKFDFKPFSQKQLRVLNWWSENSPVKDRRMMIADGSIRAGKSQPLTSKLYTPYGYKFMGDIKVGDYVFGRNGKQTKVLELFPQGILDTYRITFSDGSSTECSKEHLWTYTTRKCIANGNYTFFTSTLEDIMKDLDRFSDRKLENQRAGKYMFPINGCVDFKPKSVKIDPYLLGLLLGDGCFTEKNMGISFYGDELELHKEVANMVSRYDMTSSYVDRNDNHCGVTHLITNKLGHKSNLRIFLEEYNLYGCYSHNKFIPNDYLYNSKDVRYKVLAGLLNTDGSVHNTNKPSIEFCSTSLKLFTGVVTLARSLGMFVNTRRKIDSREKLNNVVFSCSIRADRELYSLLSSKHRNRLNLETVKDEKWRYIVSIEYVGKFEHQCILVDNKEHLYITDDFIVTHNTLAITLSFILFVMKNYNNQNAAISGKSVGAVRRNIIPNMLSMLLSLGFDYVDHRSDNYIEIIKGDTVNNVYLFGLKDATSASHIQGLTLCSAFIDEAVIADRDGFNQLLGRCSVDGSKIFCSCNPDSPYHWFYTDFIKQAKKKNILYIHFNMDDNPSLSEEIKEEYRKMFSGVWADRFIAGKWAVANGLVYDMFNDDTHIIDFNDIPFEEAQKWCLGIDYGTANPTAALLCFKTYDGDIYVVDEYYHAGGQLKGMEDDDDFDNVTGYEEQKTDLEYTSDMRMFLTDHQGFTSLTWRQLDTVIDPAAASFCLQMRKMGMRVKHANNSVLDGIRTVATYLGNNRLFICDKCTNLINELHAYSWDEKAQEKGIDAVVKKNDHACITGDTLIKTENGYIMIKDLVGTEGKVWTMNPETKEVFLSNYKNVMKTGVNRKLLRITFEDGNYIDVTPDHPILTEDGWKEAGNLTTEDNIVSALD